MKIVDPTGPSDAAAPDAGPERLFEPKAAGHESSLVGPLPSPWRRPLYADFFGLNEAPFELSPNPRFLFLAQRQREALSNLRYGMAASKGFTLLLGDAGTGKTTLVRTALAEVGETSSRYAFVSNPTLGRAEFYEFLAEAFSLSPEARQSKTRFLLDLQEDVDLRRAQGGLTGLVVDEAQSMPYELLEEIRLLGNIETTTAKLLNIVLSGQPELAERLNEPSLRQLKQRIALRCELTAFTLEETAAYVSGRLRIAGGKPGEIFTRETVVAVHDASRGIPRTINVLCDNVLIGGFAAGAKPVPAEIVAEVCRDFDLGGDAGAAPDQSASAPPVLRTDRRGPQGVEAAQLPPVPEASAGARMMFDSLNPKPKRRFRFFA
jgi:type II secretory pathway predicted ATPase ExeA